MLIKKFNIYFKIEDDFTVKLTLHYLNNEFKYILLIKSNEKYESTHNIFKLPCRHLLVINSKTKIKTLS